MPFTKGHPPSGGRPLGAKNRTTLLREERRAIFEAQISQKWEEVIDKLRPEYIADQYLGKAPDLLDVTTDGESLNDGRFAELTNKLNELYRDKPEA